MLTIFRPCNIIVTYINLYTRSWYCKVLYIAIIVLSLWVFNFPREARRSYTLCGLEMKSIIVLLSMGFQLIFWTIIDLVLNCSTGGYRYTFLYQLFIALTKTVFNILTIYCCNDFPSFIHTISTYIVVYAFQYWKYLLYFSNFFFC